MSNQNLRVGHVVTCKDFALGRRKSGYINPEYKKAGLIAVGVHDGYGELPKRPTIKEFDALDDTRSDAKFVIIEISSDSTNDSGPYGGSANTEIVKAQRLHRNGRFDKKGEVIFFYWNYNGHYPFVVEDLKIVGDMKRVFV
ncbi:MAG: hypothetical protein Q8R55_07175 [Candidatus Taylorbacteria bacterium]|nr:hypothetical protein [Candidatus Taylorbacteria bacterium]